MIDFDKMLEDWPSPFVARTKIEEFTKGLYKASTMKIYDSQNVGIRPRYRFGGKVFYKACDVTQWIEQKKVRK